MMSELLSITCFAVFSLSAGILSTRIWARKRQEKLVAGRLSGAFPQSTSTAEHLLIGPRANHASQGDQADSFLRLLPGYAFTEQLVNEAGLRLAPEEFLLTSFCLLLVPSTLGFLLDIKSDWLYLAGALLSTAPWVVAHVKKRNRLAKFNEQLPDAIDLMVSILRSGHSLPQAIKIVANDIPAPCGSEFSLIADRMSLGQALPTALSYSAQRLQSFEIDLIRRATAIQLEVGGSLADLLDKTNNTLRQRLKLKRQIRVLTSQSRMTGWIVGLMPFIIAIAFTTINPDYLKPLLSTTMGKALLALALIMQGIGILIMRQLTAFKV